MFFVAFCISDQIYNPLNGKLLPFTKDKFTFVVLGIDFLVIIVTIFFFKLLEIRFNEYSELFDKRSVEMRDFAI
jgi:hypothetical protein